MTEPARRRPFASLLAFSIVLLGCGSEENMSLEARGSTALDEYESRFGDASPCLVDEGVAQRLIDRLGAKDFRGDRRELVVDSAKEVLVAALPRDLPVRNIPTGYYYIFSPCAETQSDVALDRASWLPFRFYNATRTSSRAVLPEVSGGAQAVRFESPEGLIGHAIIFQGFTVYFGGEANADEIAAVVELFKFADAE